MRNLVKNYVITGGGKAVEVPVYAQVSANGVSEATDLANTAINPTSVTITASEVGVNKMSSTNYKKFGEFLGTLFKTIRSQALNVVA